MFWFRTIILLSLLKGKKIGPDITEIAIIGMSIKFPGADTLDCYWRNLVQGNDEIREIPQERWDWKKYYSYDRELNKSHSKWMGSIEDIDKFDNEFFEISSREAELMDPQPRII